MTIMSPLEATTATLLGSTTNRDGSLSRPSLREAELELMTLYQWDGMGYTVGKVWPPLKRLFKGPPPSFPGFPPLGRQGYSRRVHTDRSDANYDIQILHRMFLGTTELLSEGGSCSKQKEEVNRNHRRGKLLESTEGGRCFYMSSICHWGIITKKLHTIN